jgi:antitoxin VapB
MAERRVSLFRNGSNQAVRIPREFELPGKEAIMRSEDGRLVIEPLPSDSFVEYLKRMEPVTEEWPEIDDPPPEPVEL